jgi:uncharacterized membrane protein YccC
VAAPGYGSGVRARLAVIAPDLAKGVRAAIVTLVPFYFAHAWHRPELAWVALGGWLGSLADPSGPRRARAVTAFAFVAFGGAAAGLAAAAAATTVTAALALAAIVFAASLARALGPTAGSIGTSVAIIGAITASRPGQPLVEAALFAAGAAWAAVMSTIVWPVWPHVPLRVATSRVFERLGDYVDAIAAARGTPETWAELARVHQRAVRAAIEQARATALALRARRSGETPVGANLRIVLGASERLFFYVITAAEEVERGGALPAGLADTFRIIARELVTTRDEGPIPVAEPALPGAAALAEASRPLVELAREVHDIASDLTAIPSDAPPAATPAPSAFHIPWRQLVDALAPGGPIIRHALRVACTAGVAMVIGRTYTPVHPTWVAVTALAVLQPYLGPTLVRAAERVIGTILGAAVAFAAMVTIHDPLALVAVMFPLSVAAVITRPRSYRLFVLFLTPVFLLVADIGHSDWHAAGARIVDVALGGALALIAALIMPSHERLRLADALGDMLASVERYARLAGQPAPPRDAIVAARREVGLALEAAEVSLERMLAEPPALRHGVEDAMYLVTYARRLSTGITSLLEVGVTLPAEISTYVAGMVADARERAITDRPPPSREPPHADTPDLARIVRRAERLVRREG